MSLDSDKLPLSGLRVVEVSSFVASPLCGLTFAQLGAEVIRVDPLGGAADHTRLPTTGNGTSIYWTGLNRGKQSVACDMRSPEGQRVIQRLITAPGDGGGILVTNAGGREWLGHDVLERIRPDVITLEILGRRDGTPGVDYTVNAAVGFPFLTGPADNPEPINQRFPHGISRVASAPHSRSPQRCCTARKPGRAPRSHFLSKTSHCRLPELSDTSPKLRSTAVKDPGRVTMCTAPTEPISWPPTVLVS